MACIARTCCPEAPAYPDFAEWRALRRLVVQDVGTCDEEGRLGPICNASGIYVKLLGTLEGDGYGSPC
jgi:hypothetical protein